MKQNYLIFVYNIRDDCVEALCTHVFGDNLLGISVGYFGQW